MRGNRPPLQLYRLTQCQRCGDFFEMDDPSCKCHKARGVRYSMIAKISDSGEMTAGSYGSKAERSQLLNNLTRSRRAQKLKEKQREVARVLQTHGRDN